MSANENDLERTSGEAESPRAPDDKTAPKPVAGRDRIDPAFEEAAEKVLREHAEVLRRLAN